jgi:hypothetical protein
MLPKYCRQPLPALARVDAEGGVKALQAVREGNLEVLDKVIRSTALNLTPRNVDCLLGFLLKVVAACGGPPAAAPSASGTSALKRPPITGQLCS